MPSSTPFTHIARNATRMKMNEQLPQPTNKISIFLVHDACRFCYSLRDIKRHKKCFIVYDDFINSPYTRARELRVLFVMRRAFKFA
jgi:hypothetical protein